jgi:two-component system phosphate regulon response regulator PhoB
MGEHSIPDQEESTRILLIEDEQDLLELLRYNLTREGYAVEGVTSGEEGLTEARARPPGLIVLDLMLPGMDGLEVCKALKSRAETASIAIIMLTAKGEEQDVVRGLEAGADDYVPKPFSPRVLLARIRAVLRRGAAGTEEESSRSLQRGPITIDLDRHEVRVDGEVRSLTATEFRLLSVLASKPGRVYTRQQIIEAVHEGLAAVTERSVDVQVLSLRRKLGEAGEAIETIRGVGYRFKEA